MTPERSAEALPCPFCGTMPRVREHYRWHEIECRAAACAVQPLALGDTPEHALSLWNTRRSPSAPVVPPLLLKGDLAWLRREAEWLEKASPAAQSVSDLDEAGCRIRAAMFRRILAWCEAAPVVPRDGEAWTIPADIVRLVEQYGSAEVEIFYGPSGPVFQIARFNYRHPAPSAAGVSEAGYGTDSPYSKVTVWLERNAWSFCRTLLEQGRAIQQDNDAGKYPTYEHLSARVDDAARERADEITAALATRHLTRGTPND